MEEPTDPLAHLIEALLARHRRRLEGNPRMGLVLKALERIDSAEPRRIRRRGKIFLAGLD